MPRDQEGIELVDLGNGINLNTGVRAQLTNPMQLPKFPPKQFEIHPQAAGQYSHIRPVPRARDNNNIHTNGPIYAPSASNGLGPLGDGTSYPPPPRNPPPPLRPQMLAMYLVFDHDQIMGYRVT